MTGPAPGAPRVLIGGIGLPWRRDLDLGRLLAAELADEDWPSDVMVEDLSYSAHRVMHTLQEIRPARLVLVAATSRGDPPGTLRRYRPGTDPIDPEDLAARMAESVGGVIDLDHTLIVNLHFGTLPADTVVIEIEAGDESFGVGYSGDVEDALARLREVVRAEVME